MLGGGWRGGVLTGRALHILQHLHSQGHARYWNHGASNTHLGAHGPIRSPEGDCSRGKPEMGQRSSCAVTLQPCSLMSTVASASASWRGISGSTPINFARRCASASARGSKRRRAPDFTNGRNSIGALRAAGMLIAWKTVAHRGIGM